MWKYRSKNSKKTVQVSKLVSILAVALPVRYIHPTPNDTFGRCEMGSSVVHLDEWVATCAISDFGIAFKKESKQLLAQVSTPPRSVGLPQRTFERELRSLSR